MSLCYPCAVVETCCDDIYFRVRCYDGRGRLLTSLGCAHRTARGGYRRVRRFMASREDCRGYRLWRERGVRVRTRRIR